MVYKEVFVVKECVFNCSSLLLLSGSYAEGGKKPWQRGKNTLCKAL